MKKWVFLVFLFLFTFANPQTGYAQNVYKCKWAATWNGCEADTNSCGTGYTPGNCHQYSRSLCLPVGHPCLSTKTGEEFGPLCEGSKGVNTAFGCLMAGNPAKMVSQLLGWGAIVGAGIAFLMIVFAGIQIVLAGGDPKKIQAAQELISSAIQGLLLIIFSVFLINLIGVDILGLSKLGFGQ